MWLLLAFISAALLGVYDVSKKAALKDNAVIPVLVLNTVISFCIFLPFILDFALGLNRFAGTPFDTFPFQDPENHITLLQAHLLLVLKSVIVLSSWIFGYYGLKHLPITIVGPINATRPVMVLLGAIFIFGERPNLLQWAGILVAFLSIFLLSRSSKKEKIEFKSNKWILFVAISTIFGAISGLYDRFLMNRLMPMFVQSWYVMYQMLMMTVVLMTVWYPRRKSGTPFRWSWWIPTISIFIAMADIAYLSALKEPGSMIAVISLIRRGSVLVSFLFGALLFKEKNLKAKAFDLSLTLLGMILIWLGSR